MTALHRALAGLALASIAVTPAAAAAAVSVSQVWSRPTPLSTAPGVIYLTLKNDGAAPDRLMAVSTPVAASATLHRSEMQGGMMRMADEPPLAIPARGDVRLRPGGLHLMLMGLKHPLRPGDRFPVTLRFEHAGTVTVTSEVRTGRPL